MFMEMYTKTCYFLVGWRTLSTGELVEGSGNRHGSKPRVTENLRMWRERASPEAWRMGVSSELAVSQDPWASLWSSVRKRTESGTG